MIEKQEDSLTQPDNILQFVDKRDETKPNIDTKGEPAEPTNIILFENKADKPEQKVVMLDIGTFDASSSHPATSAEKNEGKEDNATTQKIDLKTATPEQIDEYLKQKPFPEDQKKRMKDSILKLQKSQSHGQGFGM